MTTWNPQDENAEPEADLAAVFADETSSSTGWDAVADLGGWDAPADEGVSSDAPAGDAAGDDDLSALLADPVDGADVPDTSDDLSALLNEPADAQHAADDEHAQHAADDAADEHAADAADDAHAADDAADEPAADAADAADDTHAADDESPTDDAPVAVAQEAPSAAPDGGEAPDGGNDLFEDLFGDNAVSSEPDAEPAEPAEPAPKKRLSLADRLARQEAASYANRSEGAVMVEVGLETWGSRRYLDGERLWGHVDRILGYVASQHDLQQALSEVAITRDPGQDASHRRLIEELVRPRLIDANVVVENTADIPLIFDMLLDEWLGLSVLGPLWRDDDVTEIMVDAWDKITVERDGQLAHTPIKFRSPTHAMEVARNLSQKVSDRAVNESNPIVTAELPGARLHFCVGKVVRTNLSISIRKFRPLMGVDKLMEFGAFNQEMVDFLTDAIGKGRANVLVSGGTGTGKTTMLNAVSSFIPSTERVVTIEDAFELTLQNEMVVSLQTKEAASADATSSVDMGALMRSSLRMRPDRIVVGEIRGPEAQVMLQAANTGHDGTMSTIHANDPAGCLSFRLPDMLLQAREMPEQVARRQVASAIDLVIQISRRAGRRFVSAIATVDVADLTDDGIEPHLMFVGDLDADGVPTHRRVGSLRTDTDLAIKMADYGADVARWSAPIEES